MERPESDAAIRLEFEPGPFEVDLVDAPVNRDEVLRYMGYPRGAQPREEVRRQLEAWLQPAAERATPRGVFAIFPLVQIDARRLTLRSDSGPVEFQGAIGEFLGVSRLVAAFIATAGPDVESLSNDLMRQGNAVGSLVANAVGAERAEAAEAAIAARLHAAAEPRGLAPTLPYSPGYCGMALSEQRKLFSLFGQRTAGVTLLPELLMKPLKSVSGLIGLGDVAEVRKYRSPCDRCEAWNCQMRR